MFQMLFLCLLSLFITSLFLWQQCCTLLVTLSVMTAAYEVFDIYSFPQGKPNCRYSYQQADLISLSVC